jgi:hypothetical protein
MRLRAARDPWEEKDDSKEDKWRSLHHESVILCDLTEGRHRILKAKRHS